MMPKASVMSGAASNAIASFDRTVSPSDTGSDFQNSTLRSLRSSNSVPRQKKKITTAITMNKGAEAAM